MATLLADPQPASSDESTAAEAVVVQTAPPDGAAPAPSSPSEPAATARNCAKCGSPLAPGQDWCLQCGAGAPGSLGTPGWRSAATILIATAVLAIGAAAAAYAALDKGTPRTHVLTTTVAQASTPALTTPTTTTPTATTPGTLGTPTTVQPLPAGKSKVPKIPLTASLPKTSGKSTTTTPTSSTPSSTNTSSTPSSPSTGGAGSEPQPVLLDTDAASTYNPYNFPAANFGDPSLTIDGDPSTAWSAQVEAATAPNMAEGVLIDLKEQQKLTALKLITSTPGMTVQVYGAKGATAPTSITDAAWIPLSHQELAAKKHLRIKLRDSSKAFGFVVLWISKAPATSTAEAPGHVDVNELELFPTE